jgi:dephospho-CoA kinase
MMELADDIIYNDSDVAALHARVESLWRELTDARRTAAA